MGDEDISGLLNPDHMGRFGGFVALSVGLVLLATSAYFTFGTLSHTDEGVWLWPFGIFGGLLVTLAGVAGIRRGVQRSRQTVGMSLDALRSEVQVRDLGFWVCTRCRVLMPRTLTGECLECGSGVDCLEVATEEDRRTALAAIPRA